MSTTITLYKTGNDEHDINKSLTLIGTYDCNLKTPVDAENPEILLNATNLDANYGYIADYGRFYFLTPLTQHNQMIVYKGISDVLMSFKAGIKASPAVIARNPWLYDKYIPDSKLPVESRSIRGVYPFPQNHFDGHYNCYILTTIGGGDRVIPGQNST